MDNSILKPAKFCAFCMLCTMKVNICSPQYHICLGCFSTSVLHILVLSFFLRHCSKSTFMRKIYK